MGGRTDRHIRSTRRSRPNNTVCNKDGTDEVRSRCYWISYSTPRDTHTTEEVAMLLDLSDDVGVKQQLSKHKRSLVTDLEPLGLQYDLLLTFRARHLACHLPLLNTQMHQHQHTERQVRQGV